MIVHYKHQRDLRKKRVRSNIKGSEETPRLSVFRSNKYIYAQIINDVKGHTFVSVCETVEEKKLKNKKTEIAKLMGKKLASLAILKKIKNVIFDRNGYRYAGRVKAFAEGAREGGLVF